MKRTWLWIAAVALTACGPDDAEQNGTEYEGMSTATMAEQVKCVFHDSTAVQECMSDLGLGCKGVGACIVDVKGPNGQKVTWKSSCGGYAFTIIDGKNEYAEFKCGAQPPPPPPPPIVTEQVKCVFNSPTAQTCYSDLGASCQGVGTCVLTVKGAFGQKVTWKSSCGGYAFTVIDGVNEYAEFKCGVVPPPPPSTTEQVKCVFNSTTQTQECISDLGFGCKGIGACVVTVQGQFGQKLTWKSSCGGTAYTLIDGKSEYAEFNCAPPPPPPPPPPSVTEAVTCNFVNGKALVLGECYSDLGPSCKGIGSCVLKVSGPKGQKVLWKSSCGGYASTLMDGLDESITFDCTPLPPPPPPPPPPVAVEQVKCVFNGASTVQECTSDLGLGCKGIGACVVDVKGPAGQKVLWKSTCGGYATTLLDGISEYAQFTCK